MRLLTGILVVVGIAMVVFYAAKIYNGQNTPSPSPLLVKDNNDKSLPKQFRTMQDDLGKLTVTTKGLENLHASGSAAMSEKQLVEVKEKLPSKHITVVDLRQESHGYINGQAVSWYGVANAANKGKTQDAVINDEMTRLAAIRALTTVEVADIKDKSGGVIRDYSSIPTQVTNVQTEEEMVKSLGLGYERFTVRDHAMPSDAQVDGYITLIRDLPDDNWLHVHCRGGKGRTTTFLAVYDMMKNAKDVSLNNIITRQYGLGGSDLFETEQDEYKKEDAAARKAFLERFYQYAKENNDGFKTLWSEWLKQRQ